MTLSDLARNATLAFCCTSFCLFFASERHALAKNDRDKEASLRDNSSLPQAQTSSKAKPSGQSTTKKLANPLNDLLDEAQRDIDQNQFEAAITLRAHAGGCDAQQTIDQQRQSRAEDTRHEQQSNGTAAPPQEWRQHGRRPIRREIIRQRATGNTRQLREQTAGGCGRVWIAGEKIRLQASGFRPVACHLNLF